MSAFISKKGQDKITHLQSAFQRLTSDPYFCPGPLLPYKRSHIFILVRDANEHRFQHPNRGLCRIINTGKANRDWIKNNNACENSALQINKTVRTLVCYRKTRADSELRCHCPAMRPGRDGPPEVDEVKKCCVVTQLFVYNASNCRPR